MNQSGSTTIASAKQEDIKKDSKSLVRVEVGQKVRFRVLLTYAVLLIVFGVAVDGFWNSVMGLKEIIKSPGILISDYVAIAGIGAAFVNAGLVALFALIIIKLAKAKISGLNVAAFFTIAGFALFGKNILNIWPIILGVWLHAKVLKRNFADLIPPALFGTALGPLVSKVALDFGFNLSLGIVLGSICGIIIGFIIPSLASHLAVIHQGYNLYNIGFTAGIIGTAFMALFRGFGMNCESVLFWAESFNHIFVPALLIYFGSMILGGVILGKVGRKKDVATLKSIMNYSKGLATDFIELAGFGPVLMNMGIMGILGMLYVIMVGGALNGPTIGGLFTIVGFSAFGKHPRNVIPIFIGVYLGTLTKIWSANAPGALLAALFGTTLAPIAGGFGPLAGIVAGFLHLSVVMNIGFLHGGTNLYNNGFAGGIVAGILVPLIRTLGVMKPRTKKEQEVIDEQR
ncbi:MAG TPA: DUF1576 domain-containing protein [Clostridia bacterium]|nr:DUF1576 domain-containing protein [Clostridia bacterium]